MNKTFAIRSRKDFEHEGVQQTHFMLRHGAYIISLSTFHFLPEDLVVTESSVTVKCPVVLKKRNYVAADNTVQTGLDLMPKIQDIEFL